MSEHRITQVEVRMEGVERRLDRMEGKIDGVVSTLADIRVELAKKPSTAALWTMVAAVLGVALTLAFGTFVIAEWVVSRATG